jgi:hypothetical protein
MPTNKHFWELSVGQQFHSEGRIYTKVEPVDNDAFVYNARTAMDEFGNFCFQFVTGTKMVRLVE